MKKISRYLAATSLRTSIVRNAVLAFAALAFSLAAPAALAQSQSAPQSRDQPMTQNGDHDRDQTRTDRNQDRNRATSTDTITGADSDAAHNWTTDQIVTATVHQAWVLSGKDEANFFEIVKDLAEISARNRNLTLPDDPAAGRRAGAYIKAQAKADHDQLLYAIVDKSVRMTGKPAPAMASTH